MGQHCVSSQQIRLRFQVVFVRYLTSIHLLNHQSVQCSLVLNRATLRPHHLSIYQSCSNLPMLVLLLAHFQENYLQS
ncbi:hypothetical protein J8L73_12765 [Pseudoalteromonas sp. MMG006]|nr:hypothetical protein [Pseudoalteromonas sp. MMG006]